MLREAGIDIAVNYGDPNYYSRIGFSPDTEAFIPEPFKLQYLEGWLAQPLSEIEITPLKVTARCIEVFNESVF